MQIYNSLREKFGVISERIKDILERITDLFSDIVFWWILIWSTLLPQRDQKMDEIYELLCVKLNKSDEEIKKMQERISELEINQVKTDVIAVQAKRQTKQVNCSIDLQKRKLSEIYSRIKKNEREMRKFKSKSEIWLEILAKEDRKCEIGIQSLRAQIDCGLQRLEDKIDQIIDDDDDTVTNESHSEYSQNQMLRLFSESSLTEFEKNIQLIESINWNEERNKYSVFQGGRLVGRADYTWVLRCPKRYFDAKDHVSFSKVFPLPEYNFSSCARLARESSSVLLFSLCFKSRKSNWQPVSCRPLPAVYFVLRARTKNGTRSDDIVQPISCYFNTKLIFNEFLQESGCFYDCELNDRLYQVEHSVAIEVYVEPPTIARQIYSNNGTLLWAIDGYKKRRRMESEGMLERQSSPYFYTGSCGYRVQANMWLNGYGDNVDSDVTAEISFLNGKFDAHLPKAFAYRTSWTIFNLDDPSQSIFCSYVWDIKNASSYYAPIGSQEDVERCLKNDTLYYQVIIEDISEENNLQDF